MTELPPAVPHMCGSKSITTRVGAKSCSMHKTVAPPVVLRYTFGVEIVFNNLIHRRGWLFLMSTDLSLIHISAGMVPTQKSCVGRVDFPGGDWNRLCGGRVCQSIHFKSRDASVLGIGDTKCQIKIWWNWYFPYRYLVLPENMPKNRLKMRKFQHCFSEIHCI